MKEMITDIVGTVVTVGLMILFNMVIFDYFVGI